MIWIRPIDLFLGIIFIVEGCYNFFLLPGKYKEKILDYERIIEVVNIIEIFSTVANAERTPILIFMRSIRATRIKKVRKLSMKAKYFIKKYLAQNV